MILNPGTVPIPDGNRTEHYYYAGWSIVEMRDGSNRTWQQFVRGVMGMDDWVRYDLNTDTATDNDCLDSDGSESYYYHRDRNTRVVALTDENGAVIERYEYDAYGNPTITIGDPGGALGFERGAVCHVSSVGNPFMHQGLFFVPSLRSYQNRFRQYHAELGRFMQRDPLGYVDGMSLHEYVGNQPLSSIDPRGLDEVATGGNHVYPLGLGGNPRGPTVPMDEVAHTRFHDYFREKGINPATEAGQAKWATLSKGARENHMKNALLRAGVESKKAGKLVRDTRKFTHLPGTSLSKYRNASLATLTKLGLFGAFAGGLLTDLASGAELFDVPGSRCQKWLEAFASGDCDGMYDNQDGCYQELVTNENGGTWNSVLALDWNAGATELYALCKCPNGKSPPPPPKRQAPKGPDDAQ